MKILPLFILLVVLDFSVFAQTCLENARPVAPVLSENTRKIYETKLSEAKNDYEKNPRNADAIIWLGRRTAYLGNYKEAIKIFTEGIGKFPNDARFYRHRGHRFITIRCFDDAIKDFETAAKLTKAKRTKSNRTGFRMRETRRLRHSNRTFFIISAWLFISRAISNVRSKPTKNARKFQRIPICSSPQNIGFI
jgi:tetratricopeptide (TPR) repeat protein